MFLSPPSPVSPIYFAELRLTPLYTLHFASQTRSEQGRGEQSLLIGVYRSSAEYIGGSGESCQYRAKNQQATTKGTQKSGGGIWLLEVKFSKGFDRDVIKVKYS